MIRVESPKSIHTVIASSWSTAGVLPHHHAAFLHLTSGSKSRLTQHPASRDLCRSAGLMSELEEDGTKVTAPMIARHCYQSTSGGCCTLKGTGQARVQNSDDGWTLPKLPRSTLCGDPGIRLPAENRKIKKEKERECHFTCRLSVSPSHFTWEYPVQNTITPSAPPPSVLCCAAARTRRLAWANRPVSL